MGGEVILITCSFGTANTGLSVYYRILEADKSIYLSRRNTGITELVVGSGVYGVEIADASLTGRTVIWDIDGTSKSSSETFVLPELDVSAINWADLWASMPTGVNVNVISPVYLNGNVQIISGDDYATPEDRELSWTDTNNIWPDLTGATFKLSVYHNGLEELSVDTVIYDADANKIVAQILSSDTDNLTPGKSPFDVEATLGSGRKATLIRGRMEILNSYSV